ncbi:MAG: LacI family DNA-binding transcriptional regulator [Actinomycetes bacterium]
MSKVTIYDVAERAGVAPSTVSRAFSLPGRVNAVTRERITAAAAELGYQPKGQTQPGGRHRTIAMVLADITNPHFFELIRGAEQRAKAASHTLVLVNAEESAGIELAQVHDLTPKVDGFVLASSRLPDQELRDLAAHHQVVLLNRELEGLVSVRLDTESGCRQILEHLTSLGHRRFTYCAGPPGSWMGAARWAALSSAAETYGLEARRIGPYTPTVASGGAAADAALRPDTTALVAHNDLLAMGIIRRLTARGVRVPEEVSVIGFDNIFAADLVRTPLTTLGGPGADAGRRAVDLLLASLDRRPVRSGSVSDTAGDRVVLPTELVLRESSGPADPERRDGVAELRR